MWKATKAFQRVISIVWFPSYLTITMADAPDYLNYIVDFVVDLLHTGQLQRYYKSIPVTTSEDGRRFSEDYVRQVLTALINDSEFNDLMSRKCDLADRENVALIFNVTMVHSEFGKFILDFSDCYATTKPKMGVSLIKDVKDGYYDYDSHADDYTSDVVERASAEEWMNRMR